MGDQTSHRNQACDQAHGLKHVDLSNLMNALFEPALPPGRIFGRFCQSGKKARRFSKKRISAGLFAKVIALS